MAKRSNRRHNVTVDVSLERGQVTSLIVGSVVALGAVFLLGVGVGRRATEPAAAGAQSAAPEAAVVPPELTFHDALTSRTVEPPAPAEAADRPQSDDTPAPAARPASAPAAPEPPAAKPEPASAKPEAVAAKPEPAPAKPEPAPAKPEPAPARPEPVAETGPATFSVQVASSQDEVDTRKLAEKLTGAGYDARVVAADIAGRGRWYRVRVGRFESREDASLKQAELKVALDLSGLVVAD